MACLTNVEIPISKLNLDVAEEVQEAHHQATILRRSTVQDIQINKAPWRGQFVQKLGSKRERWKDEGRGVQQIREHSQKGDSLLHANSIKKQHKVRKGYKNSP